MTEANKPLLAATCCLLWPALVLAQSAVPLPARELFAGPTYWHANAGTWGAHLGAGLRFPAQGRQFGLAVIGFHGPARTDSTTPAVTSIELEASLAVVEIRPQPHLNLFLSLGFTRTHFDARRQTALLARCTPETFCMAEGVTRYRTGTRGMWVPGLGLELPVGSSLALRPHVRVLLPQADDAPGARSMARIDLAVQWRR